MSRTDTARLHTIEAGFPWALPPVSRVYLTPHARVRRARNRFMASAFVADIRAGWQRSLTILGAFAAAYAFIVVLRGAAVAADMLGALQ